MALTKKQEDAFVKIYTGSLLLHNEIGIGYNDEVSESNMDRIQAKVFKKAANILGDSPSFGSTEDIIKFVLQNY